jgi:ubiquinone/menaquinone biosynthesis C-methylase UbiE
MSEKTVVYMETEAAYDNWARVYDTDGNVLQAIDDLELEKLLPKVLDVVNLKDGSKIVDFGAGTGRNTAKMQKDIGHLPNTTLYALDASSGMLEKAKERCRDANPAVSVEFHKYDAYKLESLPQQCRGADMLISTLVVEHLPLDVFLENLAAIIKPGGYALITNMHSDMGAQSQAGFVQNGVKVRPTSFPHSAQELINVAARYGFNVHSLDGKSFLERGISAEDLDNGLFGGWDGRGKKWINNGMLWFGLCLRLKED